jgi:hypothetical protein
LHGLVPGFIVDGREALVKMEDSPALIWGEGIRAVQGGFLLSQALVGFGHGVSISTFCSFHQSSSAYPCLHMCPLTCLGSQRSGKWSTWHWMHVSRLYWACTGFSGLEPKALCRAWSLSHTISTLDFGSW